MRRFLFLLILLALLPVAAVAQDVSGADRVTDSQGFSGIGGLFDGKKNQGTKAQDHARLTLEDPEGLRYLYLIFDTEYPGFRVTGEHGEEKEAGQEQFLHTLVDLTALFGEPQKRVTISFDGGPVPLYELYLFTDGELPDWVQQWEAPVEGATDLVLFSTHCDDEQLFFAGVLPYYAGELGYRVEVVYLTNHRNLNNYRCHEALDGLWACGVRQYPVFGGFADYYSRRGEDALNQYRIQGVTREDLQGYVVEQLRRFRPLVALGHDLKGEYAHGAHILYATLLTESWEAAGEETAFPEAAQRYGTWLTPKLYLHSYEENQIVMDWDQPLKAFGGMTAYEVCKERGFPSHASQVATASGYLVSGFITTQLEKKWVAFCVLPGSTAMSHAKSQFSVKVWNAQMPVGIMPRRPLINISQSPMPPCWAAFGCTLETRTRSTKVCAAFRFSSELIVNCVLSSFSRLPPYCATTLKNSL